MKLFAVLLCGAFVSGAWAADDSSSKMTLPEATKEAPAVEERKAAEPSAQDKKITDLEIRANAGSKRRVSLQFFYGYSGPAINDLNDPNRPNPNGLPGDYRTYMSGSGNLRVRLDDATGLNFGTGMSFFEPWQAISGQDQTRPRQDSKNYGFNNPAVSIDRTYKVSATQMSSKLTVAQVTDQGYKAVGEWGSATYTQYVKWVPFQTRWTLGFKTQLDYFAYARDYNAKDGKAAKNYLTFIPSVEYKLADNLNFNTSLGYSYYEARKDGVVAHPLTTWRVGVGWAIRKDIYINPYLNFFAESPALNTTNLAFNTTFSIF